MPNLGGWEFVILIGILVLLFGAKKLPDMARSIGQSARVFKGEMKGLKDDDTRRTGTAPPTAPATPPSALPGSQQPVSQQPVGQQPSVEPERADEPGRRDTAQ